LRFLRHPHLRPQRRQVAAVGAGPVEVVQQVDAARRLGRRRRP